jgi:hypothetical protein
MRLSPVPEEGSLIGENRSLKEENRQLLVMIARLQGQNRDLFDKSEIIQREVRAARVAKSFQSKFDLQRPIIAKFKKTVERLRSDIKELQATVARGEAEAQSLTAERDKFKAQIDVLTKKPDEQQSVFTDDDCPRGFTPAVLQSLLDGMCFTKSKAVPPHTPAASMASITAVRSTTFQAAHVSHSGLPDWRAGRLSSGSIG